jgi:hypothetical protein
MTTLRSRPGRECVDDHPGNETEGRHTCADLRVLAADSTTRRLAATRWQTDVARFDRYFSNLLGRLRLTLRG